MTWTPVGRARHEIEIKRSRFIANAGRVKDEAATLEFYESVADQEATHNCWAWRIDMRHRFNDDGEPASTAGRPILATLEGQDMDQVMVVVTRHYGGTKLGVGGLVRAYSSAAAGCLNLLPKEKLVRQLRAEIKADFALSAPVHQLLDQHSASKLGESYDSEGFNLLIELPQDHVQAMQQGLSDISRGQAKFWLKR